MEAALVSQIFKDHGATGAFIILIAFFLFKYGGKFVQLYEKKIQLEAEQLANGKKGNKDIEKIIEDRIKLQNLKEEVKEDKAYTQKLFDEIFQELKQLRRDLNLGKK